MASINISQGIADFINAASKAGWYPGYKPSPAEVATVVRHTSLPVSQRLQAANQAALARSREEAMRRKLYQDAKLAFDMAAAKQAFQEARVRQRMDTIRNRAMERIAKALERTGSRALTARERSLLDSYGGKRLGLDSGQFDVARSLVRQNKRQFPVNEDGSMNTQDWLNQTGDQLHTLKDYKRAFDLVGLGDRELFARAADAYAPLDAEAGGEFYKLATADPDLYAYVRSTMPQAYWDMMRKQALTTVFAVETAAEREVRAANTFDALKRYREVYAEEQKKKAKSGLSGLLGKLSFVAPPIFKAVQYADYPRAAATSAFKELDDLQHELAFQLARGAWAITGNSLADTQQNREWLGGFLEYAGFGNPASMVTRWAGGIQKPESGTFMFRKPSAFSWEEFKDQFERGYGFGDIIYDTGATSHNIWVDRFAGLAGDFVLDPFTFTPAVTGKLANVGRLAERGAGRAAFLSTRRGEALISGARKVVGEADDVATLTRRLGGGLGDDAAKRILSAKNRTLGRGVEDALDVLKREFVSGKWNPRVTLRRQAAAALTKRGVTGRTFPGVFGKSTFKGKGIIRSGLERVARGTGRYNTLVAVQSIQDGVNKAARRLVEKTKAGSVVDYWSANVGEEVADLSQLDRWARLYQTSMELEHPGFTRLLEAERASLSTGMGTRVVEERLRNLEVFADRLVKGDEEAVFLAYEAGPAVDNLKDVLKTAQGDLNLDSLPLPQKPKPYKPGLGPTPKPRKVANIWQNIRGVKRTITAENRKARAGLTKSIKAAEREFEETAERVVALHKLSTLQVEDEVAAAVMAVLPDNIARDLQDRMATLVDEIDYLRKELAEPSASPRRVTAENRLLELQAELDGYVAQLTRYHDEEFNNWLQARLKQFDYDTAVGPLKVANDAAGREQLTKRIALIPADIEPLFRTELERLVNAGAKNLDSLARKVEAVLNNKELLEQARKVHRDSLRILEERKAFAALRKKPGLGLRSIVRGPAEMLLAVAEAKPPSGIRFHASENSDQALRARLADGDRWLQALGMDANTRRAFARELAQATSEEEVQQLIREALTVWAAQVGVPPSALLEPFEAKLRAQKQIAFGPGSAEFERTRSGLTQVTGEGELEQSLQLITQRQQVIPLLDPDELRLLVREHVALHGSGLEKLGAQTRAGLGKVWRMPVAPSSMKFRDELITLDRVLKGAHKFWKFAVVTNAPAIAAGVVGGLIGGEDWQDRLKSAGIGFFIGSLGGLRYIGRVAGIEEHLRTFLSRGYLPQEWVPFMSKRMRRSGVDLPFRPHDLVAPSIHPTRHLDDATFIGQSNRWIALGQTDTRYLDGWWRVVNYQIHPQTDILARLALEGLTGTYDDWRRVAKMWFDSEAGADWLKRFRSGIGNSQVKPDEVLDRYENFINYFLPTDELKRARLDNVRTEALIDRNTLKRALKAGDAPPVVHAQESWKLPRKGAIGRQLAGSWRQIYSRLVLEKPTGANRLRMAENIYKEEYKAFLRSGLEPREAQTLAENIAVEMTNKVMFQLNDESRFAVKADFFFPFQQPREELVRVWSGIVANNKARALQVTSAGARVFNAGKNNGIFYEDQHGEWRMRVPGSAWLSRVLGGVQNDDDEYEFDFKLRDTLFFFQGAGSSLTSGGFDLEQTPSALAMGVRPIPGGPFWTMATQLAFKVRPDILKSLQEDHKELFDILFPFGAKGTLFRAETNRLWMAMTLSTPPWELFGRDEQQNALNRTFIEIYQQDVYAHRDDPFYVPDLEKIKDKTKMFLRVWATIGSVVPATTRPLMPGWEEFQRIVKLYKDRYGESGWVKAFYDDPETEHLRIFMTRRTLQTKEMDFEEWLESGEYDFNALGRNEKRYLSLEEYHDVFREAQREARLWNEFHVVLNSPYSSDADRALALDEWFEKKGHEGFRALQQDDYFRKKELARIMFTEEESNKASAIDRWRRTFGVSFNEYTRLRAEIAREGFAVNPWNEADTISVIQQKVNTLARSGMTRERAVAQLPVAEQVKYWQAKLAEKEYLDPDRYGRKPSAQAVVDEFKLIDTKIRELFRNNPQLYNYAGQKEHENKVVATAIKIQRYAKARMADEIQKLNDHIFQELEPAIDAAVKAKDWTTYYRLKDERTKAYDLIKMLKDMWYKARIPDIEQYAKDLKAMTALMKQPESAAAQQALERWRKMYAEFGIPIISIATEERDYYRLGPEFRRAYVEELTERLSQEDFTPGKLLWSYLTEFQKDLLEKHVDDNQLFLWKAKAIEAADGGKRGYSRPRRGYYYRRGRIADGELSYAYALFKKYNRRTGPEPAAYKEYLALPRDPAIRRQFLKEHPEVAEWIRLGPMANMSDIERYIVTDIMIRHGKWEGEPRDMESITELAFARLQMERFNMRGDVERPAAYDIWLAMPTGVEKAEFLRAHPEVQDWIRRGPMANMPDEYKDVVRDIMLRYGEWTQGTDPLGMVINEFYSLPSYARQPFLDQHPELLEYWRALRTPEEQRLADMAEQYFSITDPTARRVYLSAHPELQEYFLQSRQRRYEKFLNRVAMFMGQNPELFEQYLQRQEDILHELINRFGQKPLVLERPLIVDQTGKRRRSESGRVRFAA